MSAGAVEWPSAANRAPATADTCEPVKTHRTRKGSADERTRSLRPRRTGLRIAPGRTRAAAREVHLRRRPCTRGPGSTSPDFLAVVDVDPDVGDATARSCTAPTMPNVGDELHHFGWNACSSACHSQLAARHPDRARASAPRASTCSTSPTRAQPQIKNVIEGEEIKREARAQRAAHGPLHARATSSRSRCWATPTATRRAGSRCSTRETSTSPAAGSASRATCEFIYDFWYQPRQNTLVSSEWGAPNTFKDGFNPADVGDGKYGRKLHFWDLEQREQIADDRPRRRRPDPARGALAARPRLGARASSARRCRATSSACYRSNGGWAADKVIDVEPTRSSRAGRFPACRG